MGRTWRASFLSRWRWPRVLSVEAPEQGLLLQFALDAGGLPDYASGKLCTILSINMDSPIQALEKLEDAGYRLTTARRRLLEFLGDQEEGLSAEEVVARMPSTGRATGYRTLRLLLHEGLLCKVPFEGGAPRYVLSSRLAHHHHVICVGCGRVREFRESMIEKVLKGLEGPDGDLVVGHHMEVYVQCASCRTASPALPVSAHVSHQ